ncbi:sigma-70 family RNA polymerase sigma factor [Actinophytocola sp.]|uniref:sigma-70 family RNA polymerase sigma factor n=1 Tax=Actinophytocola sp. TaxID=1872138 RepID=UPI0025C1571D|nr:sigma-70 family RNA polymerase sigma factor [Actinophytocola sp.]
MTELHAAHFRVLLGFVLRYVDDMQRAEDVVQETMMRTWRNIDRLAARPEKVRSYLFTVARNIITDQWRSDNRRPRLVADEAALATVPVADQVDAAIDGWIVDSALERLTDAHRAVVEALYYQGHTVVETARRLGVPEGTVKSRAFNAVRTLRAVFEEMGVLR